MGRVERVPRFIWRLLRFLPPRIAYSLGLGSLVGSFVLLLQTTGRKSGLPRVTPLQYDEIDRIIYVGSARGVKADWYRNLVEDPNVEVTVGPRKFKGYANLISDSVQIADFLELRLKLHPKMVGAMLRFEGMGPRPTREQLEQYATKRALVAIRPTEDS
jgi:deazaflavin-dependent oxidoreductase (nitroreductase family)